MEKIFITDIEGRRVEVTDLPKAIEQAKNAIGFNQKKIEQHKTDSEVLIFPEALKYWEHALIELQKIVPPKVTEKPKEELQFSEPVRKCREIFKNNSGRKGFIKNDKISPLFGIYSCAKTDRTLREIDQLEVGESCKNGGGTKITRVY